MSRKIVFNRTGPAEVLEIIEVDPPVPSKGEFRIRVKVIGLNRAEVNYRDPLASEGLRVSVTSLSSIRFRPENPAA